ncbi:tryptophan--tRNA ligase [Citroniella saccharovorans]|uniref:Tryptophan--tRNA ligase n=1 Tax=Citroniella saccharovorans TaxID=2053367 RepID=A0AAW9MUW7_9FIRM|nr:tryptophan--tRNA ligase [Citroniella saccharovorans]MEB3429414.1 tryptophan--tRNA ligase [Citroniella saccharovorans]
MTEKKIVFSGIQPSGNLTIGNFLGAMKYFVGLQEDYECFFAVADMHAITVPKIPKDLRKQSLELIALYLATGIDPKKSTIFIQSHVHQHAELAWVLSSISYMGQLSRMTQYKDKLQKAGEENNNSALFMYPVLMAADILLYQTDLVPVGEDQKQHLELARDLAIRFNSKYSETFKVPDGLIPKSNGRIMSLKNASSKMSKSDPDPNSAIYILDDRDTIIRKVRKAVTDSLGNFSYNDEQKELKNLINIYKAFSDMEIEDIVREYEGENYSRFKQDLGELIDSKLTPIRENYFEILEDKEYLNKVLKESGEKASYFANKTLRKVYKKVGFYQL